jgi:hypothetical protein
MRRRNGALARGDVESNEETRVFLALWGRKLAYPCVRWLFWTLQSAKQGGRLWRALRASFWHVTTT